MECGQEREIIQNDMTQKFIIGFAVHIAHSPIDAGCEHHMRGVQCTCYLAL